MSKLRVQIAGVRYEIELNFLPNASGELEVRVSQECFTDGMENKDYSDSDCESMFLIPVIIPDLDIPASRMEWLIIDGKPYEVVLDQDLHWIRSHRDIYPLEIRDLETVDLRPLRGDHRIKAPIPGLITQIMAKVGDTVDAGQSLLVLEAMKMENEIRSPRSGQILTLNVTAGQSVSYNDLLIELVAE